MRANSAAIFHRKWASSIVSKIQGLIKYIYSYNSQFNDMKWSLIKQVLYIICTMHIVQCIVRTTYIFYIFSPAIVSQNNETYDAKQRNIWSKTTKHLIQNTETFDPKQRNIWSKTTKRNETSTRAFRLLNSVYVTE